MAHPGIVYGSGDGHCSEQRNSTSGVTNSGLSLSTRSGGSTSSESLVGRYGRDCVDSDVVLFPFELERVHEAEQPHFGSGIVCLAEVAIQARRGKW